MRTAYEQFVNDPRTKKLQLLLTEAFGLAEELQPDAIAARDQTSNKGKWLILDSFMEVAEKIEDAVTAMPPEARN